MIRPNLKESIIIRVVQLVLWLVYPWQTFSRFDTAMCLVTLGVISVSLLCIVEWVASRLFGKEVLADEE